MKQPLKTAQHFSTLFHTPIGTGIAGYEARADAIVATWFGDEVTAVTKHTFNGLIAKHMQGIVNNWPRHLCYLPTDRS